MQFKGNTDQSSARYWDDLAELYQSETRISTRDFHYGPLLPGDSTLRLLPEVCGLKALEIGCGAGQNSIFLAKRGADCLATDISEEQLAHGRKLAAAENVEVDFRCVSMDSLQDLQNPPQQSNDPAIQYSALPSFDLIHSTYALPFSADPAKVIADCVAMLKPGGTFLLTTGHPLYAGEWLDTGDGEEGVFIPDYFRPEPDVRMSVDDKTMTAAQYWPLSQIAEWIYSAGLVIERMLEPEPFPILGPERSERGFAANAAKQRPKEAAKSEKEIRKKVPYDSAGWRELYPQLARVPVVVIFKCRKP